MTQTGFSLFLASTKSVVHCRKLELLLYSVTPGRFELPGVPAQTGGSSAQVLHRRVIEKAKRDSAAHKRNGSSFVASCVNFKAVCLQRSLCPRHHPKEESVLAGSFIKLGLRLETSQSLRLTCQSIRSLAQETLARLAQRI